jgi:RHS repeat-associated protein
MGFTTKEADEEIGVTYFGERWLIPRLGRWATPDPLHIHASGGGEALNSYHYVSGNLLQAVDPLGLDAIVLHGGSPFGFPGGVAELGRTVRELMAPGAADTIREYRPYVGYGGSPGWGYHPWYANDPGQGVTLAERYVHDRGAPLPPPSRPPPRGMDAGVPEPAPIPPSSLPAMSLQRSPRILAGFSMGGDAALRVGRPMVPEANARWDLRVVAGARVDGDFVSLLEAAAANSDRVIVIGIRGDDNMANDGPAQVVGGMFGERSYDAIVRAVTAAYGSLEAFYEAHPNVAIGSTATAIAHGGGGNHPEMQQAVRAAFAVLEERRSSPASECSGAPMETP